MQLIWILAFTAPITAFLFFYQCLSMTRRKQKRQEVDGNGVFTLFTLIYVIGAILLLVIGV